MKSDITLAEFTGDEQNNSENPKMKVTSIDSGHKFNITFDQQMVQPLILEGGDIPKTEAEIEEEILNYYQTIFDI